MPARHESLRRLPWYSVDLPPEVANGVGMIHPDERRMLYTLARDYFTGAGRIVEGGTFLGASSLSLGHGLKDRGYRKAPVIDAFDWFVIDEWSVRHFLDRGTLHGRRVSAGDNIQFAYEKNIATVADYIAIHEGNLLAKPWTSGPIEILFLDISKSWELNDYILLNWVAALIPETGILIQQDQVQEAHVWVGITMEMLADYFELIDYTMFSSMVYRLKRSIPSSELAKCLRANITAEQMELYYLKFLERFRSVGMGRFKEWTLGMVEVGLITLYGLHIHDLDKARRAVRQCEEKYGNVPDTMARVTSIKALIPGI
ncbi:MAG TPA: hypothetical protein VIS96_09530 [Terrimicrobiaceae bacterium]